MASAVSTTIAPDDERLHHFAAIVETEGMHGLAFQHLALCRRRAWLHLNRIDYAHLDRRMALGTVALVRHPQAREYLLGHPDSLSNSVMELARFIAMSTMQPRVVSADFEWHGQQLRQGDYVLLMLAGGNRDPRVFPDPETLDMTRPTEMSLVFGTGIHHCIGHLLAKMQLGELLPELFRRFEVEILPNGIEFSPVLSQRGLMRLDVRLRQRVATPGHPA